jgi:plasmid maintenance system killer protein
LTRRPQLCYYNPKGERVIVAFANSRLQRRNEKSGLAALQWRPEVGRQHVLAVDVLLAARNLAGVRRLASYRLHFPRGDRMGQQAMTLPGQWRLVVEALSE